MGNPGTIVILPGGGELTIVPNTLGGAYVSVHSGGVGVAFSLTQEGVGELRSALGTAVMARLA